MRKWIIIVLLIIFFAVTLWGIETAAAGTHRIMGDPGYRPFISFQELF